MLLIGPSGSGKSTIMNIAAGSKIECYKNEKNDWVIKADPDIAPIGHHKSETFLPNKIILSHGEVVYDCPGFNDTRGAIYDIAKSWILKQIGSHAKSIKIVFVGDMSTLKAVRGGPFLEIMDQTKQFMKDIVLENDCELIITKTDEDT